MMPMASAGISMAGAVVRTIGVNSVVASSAFVQEAGGGEVEPLDAARQHVALVEVAAVEASHTT